MRVDFISETEEETINIYRSAVEKFPKALTPKKLLLELLTGNN